MILNPSIPFWLASWYPTNVLLDFSNHLEMLAYFFKSIPTAWIKYEKRVLNVCLSYNSMICKKKFVKKIPQRSKWKRPKPHRPQSLNRLQPKWKTPKRFPKTRVHHGFSSLCRRFSVLRRKSKGTAKWKKNSNLNRNSTNILYVPMHSNKNLTYVDKKFYCK